MKLSKSGGANSLYEDLIKDGEIQRVPLVSVKRDDSQPRSLEEVKLGAIDLAPSIKKTGMVQMPVYWNTAPGEFLIIVGECRTEAARLNGDSDIAAVIKTFETTDDARKQISEIRYAENDPKTRKSLVPLDEAKFWFNYIAKYYSDEKGQPLIKKAADFLGESQAKISQFLGIHKASDHVKSIIKKHKITDYQLAYIMARMDKHPGLVDEFITKLTSADVKGGIQALASNMLKTAKNQETSENTDKATLDLPPQTAAQAEKERKNENRINNANADLKEQLQKQDRKNAIESGQENNDKIFDDNEQQTQEASDHETAPQIQNATTEIELTNQMGNVCLNISKNTIVLSTLSSQPVILSKDNVKALIQKLTNWVES